LACHDTCGHACGGRGGIGGVIHQEEKGARKVMKTPCDQQLKRLVREGLLAAYPSFSASFTAP
jgi:hypothetical protein